jgi:signal peptidase I
VTAASTHRRRLAPALLGAVGLAAVAILVLVVVVPLVTGGAARSVLTGSMSPAIRAGSLVFDRPVAPSDVRIGDILTYEAYDQGRPYTVTHRLVAIDRAHSPARLTFRGDANRTDDAVPVPATALRGRVWLVVPWLGRVREVLSDVRWLLIVLGAAGLGTYAVGTFAAERSRSRA